MSILDYAIPPILQLEPTTDCNLDCPFCLRHSLNGSEDYISFADFRKIVDASKSRYLTLHGWGEPLLHTELPGMIRYAAKKRLSVNFTTNATLLPGKTGDLLDSGLDAIAFSFPDSKEFAPVLMKNVAEFIGEKNRRGQKKPKTYINIALMEGNHDCIEGGIRLAKKTGADIVSFERSFPWSRQLADSEEKLFSHIRTVTRQNKCAVKFPPAHTLPCPLSRLTLFVRWNGDVAPCCYRADKVLGNILTDGLATVIRERVLFMKKMQKDAVCSSCLV